MPDKHQKLELIIGAKIKEMRLNAGLSQESLSIESGLDRSYISLLERGQRTPTLLVVLRLCEALNVSAEELVGQIVKERKKKSDA